MLPTIIKSHVVKIVITWSISPNKTITLDWSILMLWLLSGLPEFGCWVSFAPVSVLCTVRSLSFPCPFSYLDLF